MTVAVLEAGVVQAAAKGDTSAFGQLIDAYRATVCSVALAIVRDVPTSEDVAQDVFVAAWERLGELRDPSSLGPWLRQVTRNRAHDVWRRRQRESPADDAVRVAADPERSADAAMLLAERQAVVDEALDELPIDAREILLLFYREGRSVRHVARLLDLSEVATKKRLSRARAKLRADVLARFAEAARQSGPKAAFTTAVVAAITVGSPSIAAAAGGGALSVGGKLGKLALGGASLGAALGVAGVVVGMRRHTQRARTPQEKAALARITWASIAHIVVLCVVLAPWVRWAGRSLGMWSWYAALMGGFAAIHWLWIPAVIADRQARERREDPLAARRQRRQWWAGVFGWLVGAAASGIAVAYAVAG
ncbi:MAG: sigma-70 family RNA polymerase sigma factor [Myxococcota bacterium]